MIVGEHSRSLEFWWHPKFPLLQQLDGFCLRKPTLEDASPLKNTTLLLKWRLFWFILNPPFMMLAIPLSCWRNLLDFFKEFPKNNPHLPFIDSPVMVDVHWTNQLYRYRSPTQRLVMTSPFRHSKCPEMGLVAARVDSTWIFSLSPFYPLQIPTKCL